MASQLLGFVGIDNQGLNGIEYKYNKELKGKPGKLIVEGDPRGFELITNPDRMKTKTIFNQFKNKGNNIVLTIDEFIQHSAEKHLALSVNYNEAESGIAVVMDPKSGQVLAMANYPNFDPNFWGKS